MKKQIAMIGFVLLATRSVCFAAVSSDPFNDTPLVSSAAPIGRFHFDRMPIGVIPSTLDTLVLNGHGADPWMIKGDRLNPAVAHTLVYGTPRDASPNEPPDLSFDDEKSSGHLRAWAAAFAKNILLETGDMVVAYKPASGADARQGFFYRYQDPSTFYLVEADAVGEFLTLYRVQKGTWKEVNRISVVITPDVWHTLRLIFQKDTYEVFCDNELILGGRDKGILTPGRVGLAVAVDDSAAFNHWIIRNPAVKILPARTPHRG